MSQKMKYAVMLFTALFIDGCGPQDTIEIENRDTDTVRQHLTGLEVIAIAEAAIELGKNVVDFIKSAKELKSDTSLIEVKDQIDSLEPRVKLLEGHVADLTYAEKRGAALDLTRNIDTLRGTIHAAIDHHNDPSKPKFIADTLIEGPLFTLRQASYYTFPGMKAGSPDRFDHRAVIATFIEDVSSWIAIRSAYYGKDPKSWTTIPRNNLAAYASHLDWIATQIATRVYCQDYYSYYDRCSKITASIDEKSFCGIKCVHEVRCNDSISMTLPSWAGYYKDFFEPVCKDVPMGNTYTESLREQYNYSAMKELAQVWRSGL